MRQQSRDLGAADLCGPGRAQTARSSAKCTDSQRVRGAEPGSDALLPDLLPFQRANRMRTLVLDLDGVLVQSVWQRKHGWKTVKRPGAEAFLDTMAQYFELVVFTSRSHSYADPILNRVDPGIQSNQGPVLMYRLYKNSTQWRVRVIALALAYAPCIGRSGECVCSANLCRPCRAIANCCCYVCVAQLLCWALHAPDTVAEP